MFSIVNQCGLRYFGTPQYLIVFVSDTCWTRCAHCWYHEAWKMQTLRAPSLSFDEYGKLAASIRRIRFLSLTGGEAFMREDLVELARLFAVNSELSRYQIPTSGYDTDVVVRKTMQLLDALPGIPFRVDVSLDGTAATHDGIRNREGAFAHAIETIAQLNRIKARRPGFDVGVITTISNANQREIEAIAATVEKASPSSEWIVNIIRGQPRDPSAAKVDHQAYATAHRLIEARIQSGRFVGHGNHRFAAWLSAKNATRRRMILEILRGKRPISTCAAGYLGGVVYNDGSLFPCELLDQSFGNIRDYDCSLPRAWNSSNANAVRRSMQPRACLCTQECFHSINVVTQPRFWPRIVAERLKLAAHAPSRRGPGA
jgi:MoaA/NifB/PqqE/SkfB family radical SAM enzyme